MSYNTGPKMITDGLIMHVDAANHKSYSNRNLMSWNSWVVGSGTCTGYPLNGSTDENERVSGTNPWGNANVVWETRPNGGYGDDGGWNSDYVNIDCSKMYRFSVWVKRTSDTTGGNFYLGMNGGGGSGNIGRMDTGAEEGNPYWHCAGIGGFTKDVWYLITGHVYPYGTTYTGKHPDSGIYTIAGGRVGETSGCTIGTGDMKWLASNTSTHHRTYHYYCSETTSHLQFYQPRVDCIDGTQPTITQLLNNDPGGRLTDLSGNGNDVLITGNPPFSTDVCGKFTLDGSTQGFTRKSAMNNVLSPKCTVVMFYATTEAQELWVRGNQNNNYHLAASNNNDYYHGNCGTPSNYVDLVSVTNPYAAGLKNGLYHMWEAKEVDFRTWTYYEWFLYPSGWQMAGVASAILVYNRILSAAESRQNYDAFKGRFNLL